MNIKKVASYFNAAVDAVLPPHSLITGRPLEPTETEAWTHLKFLDAPCCDLCGYPFDYDQGTGALCGACHARRPRYDKGRSAIAYTEQSRRLVLDFKHGGRTDGLAFFITQMQRAGGDVLARADVMIPVPLHRARLRRRRFNQAALLARGLSKTNAIPYTANALLRRKNTPSQGTQSFLGRRRNVTGAFYVPEKFKLEISGANLLLIDDVLTSGATVEACASVLKRAGAAQVDVLTLMRVVRPATIAT